MIQAEELAFVLSDEKRHLATVRPPILTKDESPARYARRTAERGQALMISQAIRRGEL